MAEPEASSKLRTRVKSFFENTPLNFSELCQLVRMRVQSISSPGSFDDATTSAEPKDHLPLAVAQIIKDIAELKIYLGETLLKEKLSLAAEEQRIQLLAKLSQDSSTYCSGPAYIDMTRAATLPSLTSYGTRRDSRTYQTSSEPGTALAGDALKSGRLGRRERFLWMGQIRKWWAVLSPAAVLNLYSSPDETRLFSSISLENYQARPVTQSKSSAVFELFSPGNKTYQFIASNQEDMDSWIAAFNEGCSKRRLPNPPTPKQMTPPPCESEELYDTPDSRVRPVVPNKQEYEQMNSYYHLISDNQCKSQEQLYKNIGLNSEDDNCYYNLLPGCTEEIYQTIIEAEKSSPGTGQNRIQAIIKAIESNIAESQLYEPVDSSQESER